MRFKVKAKIILLTYNMMVGEVKVVVMARVILWSSNFGLGEVGIKFKLGATKLEMTELRGYGCQA